VAITRQMLWRLSPEPSPWPALKVDGALAMVLGATADVREGVEAFLEKRPPSFPGRVSDGMPAGYPWWKPELHPESDRRRRSPIRLSLCGARVFFRHGRAGPRRDSRYAVNTRLRVSART